MLLATAYDDDAALIFHAIAVDTDTLKGILVFREPHEAGEDVDAVLVALQGGTRNAMLRMTEQEKERLGLSTEAYAELNAGLAAARVRERARRHGC